MSDFSLKFSGFELPAGQVAIADLSRSFEVDRRTGTFNGANQDKFMPLLKRMEPGSYLLHSRQFSDVSRVGLTGSFQELTEEESSNQLALTRRRNSHGLLFGQIVLSSAIEKERAELVALKPLHNARTALHEMAATQYVNAFPKNNRSMQGLVPLGIYRDAKDPNDYAFLTKYEHAVISQDTLFWDEAVEPTPEQVKRAMGRIAIALGRIHLMGITHGDAQVKNFASDNRGVRLIDLESVEGFAVSPEGGFNEELVASRISNDIDVFVNSLNAGINDYINFRDYSESLRNYFVPMYTRIVNLEKSKVPEHARATPAHIDKLIQYVS